MNSLYFRDEVPELIDMVAVDEVVDTELAAAVPLYVRFRARGFPIVGTRLDYFDFRRLKLSAGHPFATLGDCVIGAALAGQLGLKPGNSLVRTLLLNH
ncbi:MAG: hypothetical protein U9P00_03775 [Pseudomonadota bacterium]|nr:hypothetical protein [Pseudomonadota bacterium]